MAEFVAPDPNVMATGICMNGLKELQKFSSAIEGIYAKHGFDMHAPKDYYPIQAWLDLYKDVLETFGPATLFFLGVRTIKALPFPPEIQTWEVALGALNLGVQSVHYGGYFGEYAVEFTGPKRALAVCGTCYPSDLDLGILRELLDQFPIEGHKALIRHLEGAERRDQGAETSTYEILITPLEEVAQVDISNAPAWVNDDKVLIEELLGEAYAVLNQKLLEKEAISQELRQSNETKDKFFSIISHDLRGPIGSLSMIFNDICHKGSEINDELYHTIANSAKNTHQLLENLLAWARSQKGEIEFEPVDFPIAAALHNTLGLFQGTAQQKGVTLSLTRNPTDVVHADKDMVTTVIRNLVNNALKFTPHGGRIDINAQVEGSQLRVQVTDTGVGIDAKVQETLFKLDQKVHSSLGTNSESGSGLGLILCAEFVAKNGGQIGVESQPGQGSVFWFTLPIGSSHQGAETAEAKTLAKLKAMKVLLVDDNGLHLETSAAVLRDLEVNFAVATNGAESVGFAAKEPFDLILMDIDMPKMNGVEASTAIRKQTDAQPLIVALTSYSKQELADNLGEIEFDGYLNKPLDKEKLLASLQGRVGDS